MCLLGRGEKTAIKHTFLYPLSFRTVQISSKVSLVEVLFCKMGCDTIFVQSAGLSSPGRAQCDSAHSFLSLCFLFLALRSETRYLFEIWVAVFCYQIHFRCTDESRVIVFQYYISDSLPPGQPYSVVILKKR